VTISKIDKNHQLSHRKEQREHSTKRLLLRSSETLKKERLFLGLTITLIYKRPLWKCQMWKGWFSALSFLIAKLLIRIRVLWSVLTQLKTC